MGELSESVFDPVRIERRRHISRAKARPKFHCLCRDESPAYLLNYFVLRRDHIASRLFQEFGEAAELFAEFAKFAGQDGYFGFELGHAFFELFVLG